ncbi:MAG: MarR family transcriptional regulator [Actinomycetota bacterium]|nr:MarR family transcriptional regulator [Actinomycetota bacterium]MDQ2957969.1 MarR family transcriptional regulator [Actinomycetota bacterium]
MPHRFADDDVARLRIALARISRVVDQKSSEDGLTRTQLSILGSVTRLKSIGVSELADLEGVNPTMLSRMLGKLEAAGLVRRVPGAEDRRAVRVEITATGRAMHLRLRRLRTQLFVEQLTELPDGRAAELLAALPALEALAEQMRGTTAKPGTPVSTGADR